MRAHVIWCSLRRISAMTCARRWSTVVCWQHRSRRLFTAAVPLLCHLPRGQARDLDLFFSSLKPGDAQVSARTQAEHDVTSSAGRQSLHLSTYSVGGARMSCILVSGDRLPSNSCLPQQHLYHQSLSFQLQVQAPGCIVFHQH